jgi:hypothetical protein
MKALDVNYQQHLYVTAVDVDVKCVHMAYLQFSLLPIPAIVVHGNSLTLEEFSRWYTPAQIMGGWTWKLSPEPEGVHEIQDLPKVPEPERPRPERIQRHLRLR